MKTWQLFLFVSVIPRLSLLARHNKVKNHKRHVRHGGSYDVAKIEDYPSIVAVILEEYIKGIAIIVHEEWAITSATIPITRKEVYNGNVTLRGDTPDWTTKFTSFEVTEYYIHRDYDPEQYIHNLGLFKINGKFQGQYIKPVVIAKWFKFRFSNDKAVMVGWETKGKYVDILKRERVNFNSFQHCKSKLKQVYRIPVTDESICISAIKGRSCHYYSAPGLYFKGKLIGVGNIGYDHCNRSTLTMVFTRMAKYRSWIEKHIELQRD